ncbi:hypothetical protein [Alteromonas gracilis]|uniref:hypothetical protein n=1 Tax=Alteromonas gracilis TaxID=1479524 RepID=UPI0037357062
MKKISSLENKSSPFLRIMQKGHKKTGFNTRKGELLMVMSEEDHKRIASLIKTWLEKDEKAR